MIRDSYGNTHPTVLEAVVSALHTSRIYPTDAHLALGDLQRLQENLDAIITSAACATITSELDGAVQREVPERVADAIDAYLAKAATTEPA